MPGRIIALTIVILLVACTQVQVKPTSPVLLDEPNAATAHQFSIPSEIVRPTPWETKWTVGGTLGMQTMHLQVVRDAPLQITEVRVPPTAKNAFSAKLVTIQPGRSYDVQITATDNSKPLSAPLELVTDPPQKTPLTVWAAVYHDTISEDGKYRLRLREINASPSNKDSLDFDINFDFAEQDSEFNNFLPPPRYLNRISVIGQNGGGAWAWPGVPFVTVWGLPVAAGARELPPLELGVEVVTVTRWQTLKFENLGHAKSEDLHCGSFELRTMGFDYNFNVMPLNSSEFGAEHAAFFKKVPLIFVNHAYADEAVQVRDAAGHELYPDMRISMGGVSIETFNRPFKYPGKEGKFVPIAYPVSLSLQIPQEFTKELVTFKVHNIILPDADPRP